MKWTILALAVLGLLFAGCSRNTEDIDGGQTHYIVEDAPKVIESTEIVTFSCEFSTTHMPLNESAVAGRYYTLYAGENSGRFQARAGGHVYAERSFTPDDAFFEQLQQIVSEYDFAQHNGEYYTVAGLPSDLGASLDILYASGESISTSDNQSTFLPLEAMEALVTLFDPNYTRQE